jgi:hypothetical protein
MPSYSNALPPSAIWPGDFAQVWNGEQPAPGNGGAAASQRVALGSPGGSPGGFVQLTSTVAEYISRAIEAGRRASAAERRKAIAITIIGPGTYSTAAARRFTGCRL